MNVGDKVRLLTDNSDGIVARILDNGIVEVEIEDGFVIPVARREVVPIAREEQAAFGGSKGVSAPESRNSGKTKPQKRKEIILAENGLYTAYVPQNDRIVTLYLINNTDFIIAYTASEELNRQLVGKAAGALGPKSAIKITDKELDKFENWSALVVQAIYHRQGVFTAREPFYRRFKPKAATFYRNKRMAPVIEKTAFLLQLDGEGAPAPRPQTGINSRPDAQALRESMLSPQVESSKPAPKPFREVDLHAEKLMPHPEQVEASQIMHLQLEAFEKQLDAALAAGQHEITFIHGVGNGVLRDEIHKRLGKHSNVKFFEDSQKEKVWLWGHKSNLTVVLY